MLVDCRRSLIVLIPAGTGAVRVGYAFQLAYEPA